MNRSRCMTVCMWVCLVSLLLTSANAQDAEKQWPSFRGPAETGMALEGNPPVEWKDAGADSINIKWKKPLSGEGQSSPVIWGNQIIFQETLKSGDSYDFQLVCLNRATGEEMWRQTATTSVPHEGHHNTGSFASYSPVTDGQFIWASFGSRGLYCYDMEGQKKWEKPLVKMSIRARFGEGSSPCVAGSAVVVVCDHEGDSKIFAFNKLTGEPMWEKARDEGTTWATPVAAQVNGKWQVITNGTKATRAYDVQTGELVWQSTGQTDNCIPTPIVSGDMVYLISGFRGSSIQAVKLGKTGNLDGTDAIVWTMSDGTPYVPSGILSGDRLIFCASGNNAGIVSSYNVKTGKPVYSKQQLPEVRTIYASFVACPGQIYVADRDGTVVVLKNSDTFDVLAVNQLDSAIDATPAIVGDELYIKTAKTIYCIAK